MAYKMQPSPYGYKDLLNEREFLKVQQRARELDRGTNLASIKYDAQMLMYKTRSAEYADNGIIYTQRIFVEEASFENIIKAKNFKEIEKIMLNGGLKVHCNCLAKGTQVLTKGGYKNIEDITTDDFVLSSDNQWHVVAALRQSAIKSNWVKVTFKSKDTPLVITTEHKIMWADGVMRTIKEYKQGMSVQGVMCTFEVDKIEDAEPQVGYDVCLFDEPHNYIANGIIVSNCPAFAFWGYKYKAWKLHYGLEKELRRPIIRNPYGKGFVCKHLYLVLQTFPFISKNLAKEFSDYWKKQLKK